MVTLASNPITLFFSAIQSLLHQQKQHAGNKMETYLGLEKISEDFVFGQIDAIIPSLI